MRTFLATVFVLGTCIAQAQNWALLNPAYRYNYSNDGTDTISNQIRVMDVDTLGVDSFRYELNDLAVPCSDCIDDCTINLHVPQFLMRSCLVNNGTWSFFDSTEYRINAFAIIGEQWIFDVGNETSGSVVNISEEPLFGTTDSVRTMTTELNDTVRWSRNFGIIQWSLHNGPSYNAIGVHGPDIGNLIPSFNEFFRYQPGDVVQFENSYREHAHYSATQTRFHITQRIENPGQLIFNGYAYSKHTHINAPSTYSTDDNMTWVANEVPGGAAIHSYPGSVVDSLADFLGIGNIGLIVKHHIDAGGYYRIESIPFDHTISMGSTSLFSSFDTGQVGCDPVAFKYGMLIVDTQLGLRSFQRGKTPIEYWVFATIGAVIAGDTIGTVLDDRYFHIPEEPQVPEQDPQSIFPNPVYGAFVVPGAGANTLIEIYDIDGREVRSILLQAENTPVEVWDLAHGTYLVVVEGLPPQRLVIAR